MGGQKVFLKAHWRSLAMLNYEVNPSSLLHFIPPGTELDSWSGKTFVSLVAFRFLKTRVFGLAVPFHCNFTEINLRFYVRRTDHTGVKRGVVFIQEIVPRRAIAATARWFFGERYVARRMSHRIYSKANQTAVTYGWESNGGLSRIDLAAHGERFLPRVGSQEQFITEHYWGYAQDGRNGCTEYRVDHPQWHVWQAATASFEGEVAQSWGTDLAATLGKVPYSAFLAEGSKVVVYRGRKLSLVSPLSSRGLESRT